MISANIFMVQPFTTLRDFQIWWYGPPAYVVFSEASVSMYLIIAVTITFNISLEIDYKIWIEITAL